MAKGHTALAENLLELAPGGVDINALDNERTTPLGVALKYHQFECARYLLSRRGLDVCISSRRYGFPLHQALVCTEFDLALRIALLEDAPNNAPDSDGNTPLHLLFQKFNADPPKAARLAALLVLDRRVAVNRTNKHRLTPLLLAVKRS